MYMYTNCLLFASCNKLLNNSTFYHLKSLIALPIGMIRILGGAPILPPLEFRPWLADPNMQSVCSTVVFKRTRSGTDNTVRGSHATCGFMYFGRSSPVLFSLTQVVLLLITPAFTRVQIQSNLGTIGLNGL